VKLGNGRGIEVLVLECGFRHQKHIGWLWRGSNGEPGHGLPSSSGVLFDSVNVFDLSVVAARAVFAPA